MTEDNVTIIIPTLATKISSRALKLCVESLKETCDCRIVVAHNGLYGSPVWAEDEQVEVFTLMEQGQCRATNYAVENFVKTEWIMIFNDDMIVPPGWFKKLTNPVDNFNLLVASPNLVEPQKGAPPFIEKFCGGVGGDFDEQCFLEFVALYKEHENYPEGTIEDGLNFPLLMRKDVWDTIGGYDEAYDPWGSNSDSDLQHKIMIAGIIPKRVKGALVYHFSQTSGTFHPDHRDKWEENRRYFTEKWGFERAKSPEIWYRPTIPYDKLKYKPKWKAKYGYPK